MFVCAHVFLSAARKAAAVWGDNRDTTHTGNVRQQREVDCVLYGQDKYGGVSVKICQPWSVAGALPRSSGRA
jgi:hypothetical protein